MSLQHWDDSHPRDPSRMKCAWLLPRICTWGTISMMGYWLFATQKGLGIQSVSLVGYHILGMTVFVLIANQEAVLSYAAPLCGISTSRDLWRTTHFISAMIGFFSAMGGMAALLYDSYPSYSPHSWLGWCTLMLWFMILLMKSFGCSSNSMHTLLGHSVYGLGIVTMMLGVQHEQSLDLIPYYCNQTSIYEPQTWKSYQSSLIVLFLSVTGIMTFVVIAR